MQIRHAVSLIWPKLILDTLEPSHNYYFTFPISFPYCTVLGDGKVEYSSYRLSSQKCRNIKLEKMDNKKKETERGPRGHRREARPERPERRDLGDAGPGIRGCGLVARRRLARLAGALAGGAADKGVEA